MCVWKAKQHTNDARYRWLITASCIFYVKLDNAVSTAAPYWHCLHSMRSRVYETVRWPSDCPSTAANPLLQVCCCGPGGQEMSIDLLLQRHANAGSATLSAYVCSWTQTCYCCLVYLSVGVCWSRVWFLQNGFADRGAVWTVESVRRPKNRVPVENRDPPEEAAWTNVFQVGGRVGRGLWASHLLPPPPN